MRKVVWQLLGVFLSLCISNLAYAQGNIYTTHPLLKDILSNISNIPLAKTANNSDSLYLIHYQNNRSNLINFADSIQQLIDDSVAYTNNYLDNPLYALYIIEILTKKFPKQTFKASLENYQQTILEVYESTYQALFAISLEDRVLYGAQANFVLIAHSYDLAFVLVDSTAAEQQLIFSFDFQNKSYLAQITAQSKALKDYFDKKNRTNNSLLYWAIGGILLGIVCSIFFHQLYWKKS